MRWDGNVWRRRHGHRWATAAYSRRPGRLKDQTPLDRDPAISAQAARKVLDKAIEDQVVSSRAWVVFDGDQGVILGYRHPTSNLSHAIMTFLTMGLWIPIWVIASLIYREERVLLTVDDWGNVWTKRVPD
jgi:hypothetical protein